jgi:peptidyl-prolyl cis-trans isomerase C
VKDIVAKVNDHPIIRSELINAVQGFAMGMHRKAMEHLTPEEHKEAEGYAMEKLVARELIFQNALSGDRVASDDEVKAEILKIQANFPSDAEMYATLEKAGISADDYQRMITADLTVNKLAEEKTSTVADPEENDITSFYEVNKEKMVTPDRVRASHILIKTEGVDKEEASKKIKDIKANLNSDNFAEQAKEHSACPSGARGGDLEFFGKGDMVEAFNDAAFSQAVGEVGDIIETPFGFHIILVTDTKPGSSMDLDEARPNVIRFLKGEAQGRAMADWVALLKEDAKIEVMI